MSHSKIVQGMARAVFASGYADAWDEATQTSQSEIVQGMARAFFASAYAEAWDEAESADVETGLNPSGCDWMDLMPTTMDPGAARAADGLASRLSAMNGDATLEALFDKAEAIIETSGGGDRELSPEMFGHYLAMQAMGHGVGLSDAFGREVREAIKVPYLEFTNLDLEGDYFPVPVTEG